MKRKGSILADIIMKDYNKKKRYEETMKRRNANNGRGKEQSGQTSKV
jgi:hypothetical protein